MPTDPTPQRHAQAADIAMTVAAAFLVVSLAVLAPQSLTAVAATIIAACQLRRLL